MRNIVTGLVWSLAWMTVIVAAPANMTTIVVLANATTDVITRVNEAVAELETSASALETKIAEIRGLDRMTLIESILEVAPELRARNVSVVQMPEDCAELMRSGKNDSGEYMIQPRFSDEAFRVYCDMETDGGGWTVFQRRIDGSGDFYRSWNSYKFGFGNMNGEHWLGNDRLSALTTPVPMQLRIDLRRFSGETRYATYDVFSIASEKALYKLNVGMYHGTAGDSMISPHHGQNFSTPDRDNDTHETQHCSESYKGGWWYAACHHSNLNGLYGEDNSKGVVWYTWPGHSEALMSSEMKVRPVQYALH